tara:strand:+ start:321 stop:605 length:285 start_codon:yes stop_codon:yes gene_type:complete
VNIQIILFLILIISHCTVTYIFYKLITDKINLLNEKDIEKDLSIKIELLKEQIKLSTIIIQNNSILISKNKKDIDTFEAFINAALIKPDDDIIH